MDDVRRGLAPEAGAQAAFAALSRWIGARSPHQMMAGWAAGLYTPRQVVAKAVAHGIRIPGVRDQLRCVRARGPAAPGAVVPWTAPPEELTVKLAEPARTLYLRERGLIDAWIAAAGLQPAQVALGGGSVLAARWRHRHSDDIDVVVQGPAAYAKMLSARGKLTVLAEQRGATVRWVPEIRAVRLTWPNSELASGDKLEFFGRAESPPQYDERAIELEGRSTRTLGTAQILWGKLDRCARGIVAKDVVDIREAGCCDSEALAAAVNAWPSATMRAFAQTLRSDAATLGEEIEATVRTAVPLQPGAGRTIAHEAGDSIERALYREVAIGVEKGLVRVDRETTTGVLPPLRWPPDENGVEGERTGMVRHLAALGMSVVLDDAVSVARRAHGAARLWTARAGCIVEWRRPPEVLQAMVDACAGREAPPGSAGDGVSSAGFGRRAAAAERRLTVRFLGVLAASVLRLVRSCFAPLLRR